MSNEHKKCNNLILFKPFLIYTYPWNDNTLTKNLYLCDDDDDDVYLDKLQTRGVKRSILYTWNIDYSQ
jgi:hypothetical protein